MQVLPAHIRTFVRTISQARSSITHRHELLHYLQCATPSASLHTSKCQMEGKSQDDTHLDESDGSDSFSKYDRENRFAQDKYVGEFENDYALGASESDDAFEKYVRQEARHGEGFNPRLDTYSDLEFDSDQQHEYAAEMDAAAEAEVENEVGQPRQPKGVSRLDGTYWQGQWANREMHEPPYRQPRPHMAPIRNLKDRQIPALREHPLSKQWGGLIDIIEHETYMAKVADADSGGGLHDFSLAPYDSESLEDPFYNNYMTEDEYYWPSDYEPQSYVPDSIRQQIYFLWAEKGWSVVQLAAKFKLQTERVSFIINLKRTEPDQIEQGTYAEDLDKAMTQMYARDYKYGDRNWEPDHDQGIQVNMLKDAQLPEDVVPRMPWKGNLLKTGINLPAEAQPPKEERVFKHKFAFKDISCGEAADSRVPPFSKKHRMVDYDGTRRVSTKKEDLYRSSRARNFVMRRNTYSKNFWPFDDKEADTV